MFSKAFALNALELALRGAAHALILYWAVGDKLLNAWDVDLKQSLGVAAGGFVLSLVTSLVSAPLGSKGSTTITPPSS